MAESKDKKKRAVGTFRKRGESYELSVSAGIKGDGSRNRHFKTVKAKSDTEAEKLLIKFIAEVEKGEYIEPSRITLTEFSKRWLSDYADVELTPMTRATYKAKLEKRVLPALGHLKLEQIKPLHVSDFLRNLQEDGMRLDDKPGGMGADSIIQCHRVLSSIFKLAVQLQIVQDNPCLRAKPPRPPKRNLAVWDEVQTYDALVALEDQPVALKLMVTMAALTGLRRGEMVGLEWKHIDFDKKTAKIVQVSQYVQGVGVITKEPKTRSSIRLLALPETVCDSLRAHKASQNARRLKLGNKWIDNDRIFTTWNGGPMHPNTPDKWFRDFQHDLNEVRVGNELDPLPVIRFHDLRHSAATLMITNGVDVGTVAKNLGHARPSITTDIYYQALMTAQERAANKMDELFSGAAKLKNK